MNTQNVLLLSAGLVNLIMSIIVFSRGIKNKINLYFGLLALFNFIWVISLAIGRLSNVDMLWYYGGALLAYPAALGIAVFLFYFCFYFPVQNKNSSPLKNFFIIFPAIILSVVVFIEDVFILSYDKNIVNTEYTLYVNKPLYIIYAVYFVVIIILALRELYSKIKISENLFKKQIVILFIAVLIGLIFGVYYNLVLCYFANYHYNWFGPVFTLFMNLVVFFFLISPKEKIHG